MDSHNLNYLLTQNKLIEEQIDYCIHLIDKRIDDLHQIGFTEAQNKSIRLHGKPEPNLLSKFTYSTFRAPYIRNAKNFSGPANSDLRQIKQLPGSENVSQLIKEKNWTKESKQRLYDAVLDHYAHIHIVKLIKQKNDLTKQILEASQQTKKDIEQKLSLVEEQLQQVRDRKETRIFVPEDRNDSSIDWCAISARLSTTYHDAIDCRLMWSNCLHWCINENPWTKEEDECLISAIEKFGKNDWDSVAKELNSNRLPWQCCARFNQELNSNCASISQADSEKIIEVINLCRVGNFVPWNQVMYFIQHHSLMQVKYQWHKLQTEKTAVQPWSHEEDVLLLSTIDKFGDKDWNRISSYIPGRSNKSCRERYTMRLKYPKRAIGCWLPKEDKTLISLIERFGTNWSLISSHFPERNQHQIRTRYEFIKTDEGKVGSMRHRKLYRNSNGELVSFYGRKQKPASEREIDQKLYEIFNTYQYIKTSGKSLICRSSQDEHIYQNLVHVLCKHIAGSEGSQNLLGTVIDRAVKEKVSSKYQLFTPSKSTLRGYKAWMMQQDHLEKICENSNCDIKKFTDSPEYNHILKIVMSIFLWPAVISKIEAPDIDVSNFQVGSIVGRDSKNLYKIREIQKLIASCK